MKLVKIGLVNLDQAVGAFKSNTDKLIKAAIEMSEQGCTIGCFSEQSIPGYPSEDLVLFGNFLSGQWEQLLRFAKETENLPTVFVVGLAIEADSTAFNVAAVVCRGEILGLVPKEKLPTYGVFYEKRTYASGMPNVATTGKVPFGDMIFEFSFGKMAVEVCEDIWSPDGPMRRRAYRGAETIINISASPFRSGVLQTRRELISTRAADNVATVVYVNQFGGNDGLAFDGGGFVNQCGRMLFEAPRWREGISTTVVDFDRTSRQRRENTTWRSDREDFLRDGKEHSFSDASNLDVQWNLDTYKYPFPKTRSFFIPEDIVGLNPQEEYFEDLVQAMITGLDGYFRKTDAFDRILIALSGGKDSVLTLLIAYIYATERLGMSRGELLDFIRCYSMPTSFNSSVTRNISRDLTDSLKVGFIESSISEEFGQAQANLKEMLLPHEHLTVLGLQNIQARIRGKRMWDVSGPTRGMWLQTGNMSEKAVGYTTIGGDMMGAYSLIGNLPKTVVIELLKYLNRTKFQLKVLERLIASTASAELAENQADEKDLMPFPVLDACYALFVGEKMSPEDVTVVISQMFENEYTMEQVALWVHRFVKLFRNSIFKWVQAPESVHLGSLDLDRERALQLPVVQSLEWLDK